MCEDSACVCLCVCKCEGGERRCVSAPPSSPARRSLCVLRSVCHTVLVVAALNSRYSVRLVSQFAACTLYCIVFECLRNEQCYARQLLCACVCVCGSCGGAARATAAVACVVVAVLVVDCVVFVPQ